MTTIANSPNTVSITNATVSGSVGICYFDPITESLLEIDQVQNHFVSVEPFSTILKKYYLVTSPDDALDYIRVKTQASTDLEDLYSIKIIISNETPSVYNFDDLPNLNSFRIDSPSSGIFIPLHILVKSKVSINTIHKIQLEIEYE